MKRFVRLLSIFLLVTLFCLIFPYRVYAYLDPGSSNYILQIIIAFLLGGLFTVKVFRNKITTFFKNLFSRKEKSEKLGK